jgi:hypothetical protein
MLRFRDADGRVRELHDADAVWRELRAHVEGGLIHFIEFQKLEVLALLREWISASGGDDPAAWELRRRMGQQRHILEFADHTNMARALFGEFLGRMALDEENALGKGTVRSGWVLAHLRALADRLRLHLAGPTAPEVLKPILAGQYPDKWLEYRPLFRKPGAELLRVLKDPDAFYFEDLMVTLHDLMTVMRKLAPALLEVPRERTTGTFFRINEQGEPSFTRRPIDGSDAFRYKTPAGPQQHFTLKENSGFVMAARVQGMPMWAGPSFTTARLMHMAQLAAAPPEELEAMAWGIFGFWNQCYPTSSTWIHRFHEVMDMAANWGVPYEPFAYPRAAPPLHRSLRTKV